MAGLICFTVLVMSKQLSKSEQAIEDCSKAIELDSGYLKAYLRRAKWSVDGIFM